MNGNDMKTSARPMENTPEIPENLWSKSFETTEKKSINIINLRSGIRMIQMDLELAGNVVINQEVDDSPLEFGCMFSGVLKGYSERSLSRKTRYECRSGQSWVSFYPQTVNSIEYFADQPIRCVFMQIEYSVLKEYLQCSNEPVSSDFHRWLGGKVDNLYNRIKTSTPTVLALTHQMIACPYKGVTKMLFLESKILELLVCLINEDTQQHDKKALSKADEERLRHAKEILLANMESPLSLNELAQKTGICATKLNAGFRLLFHNTVFGLLREERLAKARMLMETQEKRACEAAWEVGYSSLSSFHRAFYRKYGVNPGYYSKTGSPC